MRKDPARGKGSSGQCQPTKHSIFPGKLVITSSQISLEPIHPSLLRKKALLLRQAPLAQLLAAAMLDALVSVPLQIALEKLAQYLQEHIKLYAGADRELENIRDTLKRIKAFVHDAENKQVGDEDVRVWLSDLKGIAHDIEDVLDDADDEECGRREIAPQIKDIREKLDHIARDQYLFNFSRNSSLSGKTTPVSTRPQTGPLVDESRIIGRVKDKETVINRLVGGSSSAEGDGQQVHVTAIVGIGGLGKTTLAQQIYNDVKVQANFNQALYWVCVSDVFDEIRLMKAILEQVNRTSSSLSNLASLQQELRQSLEGKRFLLVLDDVWNDDADKWEPLRLSLNSDAQGSRILVTTRSEKVANVMNAAYIHKLQGLSDDLSWTLFSNRAFAGRTDEEYSELKSVGEKIVSKCKGVPLSIKVMGSAMNSKRTRADWQNILDSTMWSLPQVADKIYPALMLSYYNLPPHLKQCFAYCSIYQKDTEMDKDEVVKSWVGQGFIEPQGNREMEDIGEEYFNDLVARSMFQAVQCSTAGQEFQMHDLLHDLAAFIMKDERYIFTAENSHNQCSVNVRHASLFLSEDNPSIPIARFEVKKLRTSVPIAPFRAKKLRTLLVHGLNGIGTILDDFLHEARFLRVLLFGGCNMEKPPETLGKLKHLRYLGLSWSRMVELPESMHHLVKLHTLDLRCCMQLKKLPRGIGRMVSLRHLQIEETDSLESLPEGLGKISCLRSLCKFIVGGEGGCRINELQGLNALQGSLQIEHLERVSSKEEAEKAELWNKPHLRELDFRMSSGRDEEIVMSGRNDAEKEMMENVLDDLRPHPNLKKLRLHCNRSSSKLKLPSWMEDSCFSKLTELVVKGFSQCEENLLGLGKLPALKKLELVGVGVRKMGSEFYYGMSRNNDVVGERRGAAFPKLESLYLVKMSKLEEWELASEADDAPKVMPSLRKLEIHNCPELQVLPHHLAYAPLAKLRIVECGRIKGVGCSSFPLLEDFTLVESSEFFSSCLPDLPNLKRFEIKKLRNEALPNGGWEGLVSLPRLEIWECHELKSLPDGLGQLKKLEDLWIYGAEALTCLPDPLGQLESLKELIIHGCRKLVLLPDSLGQLKTLNKFGISDAEALTCLPDSLGQLESLKELIIHGCRKLVLLPHSVGQLESLVRLSINRCPQLASLPHSLGQLKTLNDLIIWGSEVLTCLPESLGQLESLKDLSIGRCPQLVSLPHSLGQLESLKQLKIFDCQKLVSLPHWPALNSFAFGGEKRRLVCLIP